VESKNKNTITVVCATNDKYALSCAAMIKSLLVNHKGDENIDFYLFYKKLGKFNKEKLLQSIESEKLKVYPIDLNKLPLNIANLLQKYKSHPGFYRLLIPYVLPEETDRAIYLDSDIIVQEDINMLWNTDFEDKIILAAQDAKEHTIGWKYGIRNYKELGLNPNLKYFNSGVLVMNLKKMRKENISKKVVDRIIKNNKFSTPYELGGDQYGLNIVLVGRWGELDARWNQFPYIPYDKEPYIVHYVTSNKPIYPYYQGNFKDLFFEYVDMTEWKGWRPPEEKFITKVLRILKEKYREMKNKPGRTKHNIMKKFDVFLKYYKNIYHKKILCTEQIICDNNSKFEVHMLTCEKDALNAIWALKTFYFYSGLRPRLVIHDDGTLTEENKRNFTEHFEGSEIISRKKADMDMKKYLMRYPSCSRFRLGEDFDTTSLKLFDPLFYSKAKSILLLDSDILFFKKPIEIIDYINNEEYFFANDLQNAYIIPKDFSEKTFGLKMISKINTGIIYIPKKMHNLDLIEFYLKNILKNDICMKHWIEQTVWALLISNYEKPFKRLSENYKILIPPITEETAYFHFINDDAGSRDNFYRLGLRYLNKNKFSEQFNQSPIQIKESPDKKNNKNKISAVLPLKRYQHGYDDAERAKMILFRSLKKFFKLDDLEALYIITRDDEYDYIKGAFKDEKEIPLCIIKESELVPEFKKFPDLQGWYKQQIIKLAIAERIKTPFYITFDADVICVKPTQYSDLVKNGRALSQGFDAAQWDRKYHEKFKKKWDLYPEWYNWAEKLLGMKHTSGLYYGVTPAIMSTEGVKKLYSYLEDRSGNKMNYKEYLIKNIPWTEYALYNVFLEGKNLYDKFHINSGPESILSDLDSLQPSRPFFFWNPKKCFEGDNKYFFIVAHSMMKISPQKVWGKVNKYLE
jgi:lipopolysaccharide biosynthesis glycosyltransferase